MIRLIRIMCFTGLIALLGSVSLFFLSASFIKPQLRKIIIQKIEEVGASEVQVQDVRVGFAGVTAAGLSGTFGGDWEVAHARVAWEPGAMVRYLWRSWGQHGVEANWTLPPISEISVAGLHFHAPYVQLQGDAQCNAALELCVVEGALHAAQITAHHIALEIREFAQVRVKTVEPLLWKHGRMTVGAALDGTARLSAASIQFSGTFDLPDFGASWALEGTHTFASGSGQLRGTGAALSAKLVAAQLASWGLADAATLRIGRGLLTPAAQLTWNDGDVAQRYWLTVQEVGGELYGAEVVNRL